MWKLVNVISCPPCCVRVEANTLAIFPISDPFGPQGSRPMEEIARLRGHVAEARWSAKDDGVRVGQLLHGRDRHFGERGFRCFRPMLLEHIVGNQLGHLVQGHLSPRHLFGTFHHGLRHLWT